jgi:hypothetical protein
MAQIAVAEPLAEPGETVISPEAWEFLQKKVRDISSSRSGFIFVLLMKYFVLCSSHSPDLWPWFFLSLALYFTS